MSLGRAELLGERLERRGDGERSARTKAEQKLFLEDSLAVGGGQIEKRDWRREDQLQGSSEIFKVRNELRWWSCSSRIERHYIILLFF